MGVYDRVVELCRIKGISVRQLELSTDIGVGIIGRWRTSSPNANSIIKVADYFGVSVDYLLGRKVDGYYINPDAVELTQAIKDRPEMKILLDATRDVSGEDIEFIVQLVNKMKRS